MQREYQRDARAAANYAHNGNGRDNNRDDRNNNGGNREHRVSYSVGKNVTAKLNGYSWLLQQGHGYEMFEDRFGCRFVRRNQDHIKKMDIIYQENKKYYKDQADKYNKTRPIKEMTHAKRTRLRNERHNDPSGDTARRRAHRRDLEENRVHRETQLPLRREVEVFIDTEQEAYLKGNCEKSELALRALVATRIDPSNNPIIAPDYISQVVSVFPLVYTFRGHIKKMFCFPAEVGITTFHLQKGIIATESIFVMFDPKWFEDEDENEIRSREMNSRLLGIDRAGPRAQNIVDGNVYSSWEAFQWIMERFETNPSKRIFFDAKQLNFVFYGIKNLAHCTGLNAIRYFQEKIVPNLVSIQDYTVNLLRHGPVLIPPECIWSRKEIEKQFEYFKLFPNEELDLICDHHKYARSPHKYYCVRAHNARILHNFMVILDENAVDGVQTAWRAETFVPWCRRDMSKDSTLPPTLCAQTITVEQMHIFFPGDDRWDIEPVGFEPEEDDDGVDGDFDSDTGSDEDYYDNAPCSYNSSRRPQIDWNRPSTSGPPRYPRPPLHNDPATVLLMSRSYHNPTEPSRDSQDVPEILKPDPDIAPVPTAAPAPSEPAQSAPTTFYTNATSKELGSQKSNIVELKDGQWETPVIEYIYGFEDSKYYTKRNKPIIPKPFEKMFVSSDGCLLNPSKLGTSQQAEDPEEGDDEEESFGYPYDLLRKIHH